MAQPFRPARGRYAGSKVLAEMARMWDQAAQRVGTSAFAGPLTQYRLAKEAGVPTSTVSSWATGTSLPRDLDQLIAVVEVLAKWTSESAASGQSWAALLDADRSAHAVVPVASVSSSGSPATNGSSKHASADSGAYSVSVLHGVQQSVASRPERTRVSNVPARIRGFEGRERVIAQVREEFVSGQRDVVQVLHGLAGVGKSLLAIKYADLYGDEYDIVWWIHAERASLIAQEFADLAAQLGCAKPGLPLSVLRRAVRTALQERGRWLLIFDNAERPEDITEWLAGGTGHVLITSRARGWDEVAVPVKVDVFDRLESVAILRKRMPALPEGEADRVAEALGDLPLAVAQAADYLHRSQMPIDDYVNLLQGDHAARILARGTAAWYRRTVTATTNLSLNQLAEVDSVAARLATIRAFLAHEPVPLEWFSAIGAQICLPEDSQAGLIAQYDALDRLDRSALARVDGAGLVMHPLTRAIIRTSVSAEQAAAARTAATKLLSAHVPGDTGDPANWSGWARLLPHVLALRPEDSGCGSLRQIAGDAARYLARCGDYQASHDLARSLHDAWQQTLDSDHQHTLLAARVLGEALRRLGRYDEAQGLDEDTLIRYRRVNGEDHPDTLNAASNLGIDLWRLGKPEEALDLHRDCLAKARSVLGADDASTLVYANNLAIDLLGLGQAQEARELDEDTLQRRRRVLRDDHLFTLSSAHNLAVDLRTLGEFQAARAQAEDTLSCYRRVLGDDHPDTLDHACLVVGILRDLGESEAARDLHQDTHERRQRVMGGEPVSIPGSSSSPDRSVAVALARLRNGRPEAAAAVFKKIIDESPEDEAPFNNYGFCVLPYNPEAALDSLMKAARLHGDSLIALANTVLTLHLLGRDTEALRLASTNTAVTLPEADGTMWLVGHDDKLKLSNEKVNVRVYLRDILRHINFDCDYINSDPEL